jgi:predicted ATPase
LKLAEQTQEVAPQLIALIDFGIVGLALGDLASARRHFERALGLFEPATHDSLRLTYSFDPQVIGLGYLSWTLFSLGYAAQALECSRQSVTEARKSSHPMTLAFALTRSSAVLHMCRDQQAVAETAAELIALAVEKGLATYKIAGRFYHGWAQVQQGCSEEGLALLQEMLTELRASGNEDWFPHSLSLIAEAHHVAGRVPEGLQLLAEASERVERNDERWFAAEVHRLRGELLLSLSDLDEAEGCFLRATRVAREQGAKMWELRAAASLARLWTDQGRRHEAHDLLAPIYGWFTEGLDTPDLREAKVLLGALTSCTRPA